MGVPSRRHGPARRTRRRRRRARARGIDARRVGRSRCCSRRSSSSLRRHRRPARSSRCALVAARAAPIRPNRPPGKGHASADRGDGALACRSVAAAGAASLRGRLGRAAAAHPDGPGEPAAGLRHARGARCRDRVRLRRHRDSGPSGGERLRPRTPPHRPAERRSRARRDSTARVAGLPSSVVLRREGRDAGDRRREVSRGSACARRARAGTSRRRAVSSAPPRVSRCR